MSQLPLPISPGAHLGEYDWMARFWDYLIYDHAYSGNLCGGFGGKTECRKIDWETGQRCGRPPTAHGRPYAGRHRREMLGVDGFKQVSHLGRKVRCPACDRSCVLMAEELLATLPERQVVDLPCGCAAAAGYLRRQWAVKRPG